MSMLLVIAAAPLWAQDVSVPDLDAQRFRPSVDARATLWTDDAGQVGWTGYTLGALVSHARNPLIYEDAQGEELIAIGGLSQLDLTAAGQWDRLRLGVRLPVAAAGGSDLGAGGSGIGDISLDGRATLLGGPLGLAARAGATLPSSTLGVGLGSPGVTWGAGLIATAEAGPLLVSANAGFEGVPEADVLSGTWGNQLYGRLGAGLPLGDRGGVSAELAASRSLSDAGEGAVALPVELLLGGWVRGDGPLALRGGVGSGLTEGIGSPDVRAVLGIVWAWDTDADADGDGISDRQDACPAEPEDLDGDRDADGCPESGVAVSFVVTDQDGAPVSGVDIVAAGDGSSADSDGGEPLELAPGLYQVSLRASGHRDQIAEVVVPDEPRFTAALTMERIATLGAVRISVTGPDGAPVAATWQRPGAADAAPVTPDALIELPPGEHTLIIRSGDLAPTRSVVRVEAGATSELVVSLQPRLVEVTADRIKIQQKIFFELNKSTIKPESYALLDQVAQALLDHPELTQVLIEGHTDSRGSVESNQRLSQERADAVRAYLTSQGIDPQRLTAQGFGEAQPLVEGENERAWAANRRVEFRITAREQ